MDYVSGEFKSDSEENGLNRSRRDSSNRRKREWRGLGRDETFTLFQNTPVENVEPETTLRKQSPLRKSRSPRHEKRRIQEEKQTLKVSSVKSIICFAQNVYQPIVYLLVYLYLSYEIKTALVFYFVPDHADTCYFLKIP